MEDFYFIEFQNLCTGNKNKILSMKNEEFYSILKENKTLFKKEIWTVSLKSERIFRHKTLSFSKNCGDLL